MTISIIGGTSGDGTGTLTLAWPSGSAAGDVAVLIAQDDDGPVVPSGWTGGDVITKTLGSGDIAGDLTASVTGVWYGVLAVIRGVAASSVAGVDLGSDIDGGGTFTLTPVSAHAGPMAVLYLVLAVFQPGKTATFDSGVTALGDVDAGTGGAYPPVFPSGYDQRILLAGLAQSAAGATPSIVVTDTGGAAWWQAVAYTFDPPGTSSSNDVAFHAGGSTITVSGSGGTAAAGDVAFHGGATILLNVWESDFPAPAPPSPEDVDLDAGDDADVIERISDTWDAPALVDDIPVDWVMS